MLMRAVAEVVINEEKARAAADRELAAEVALLRERIDASDRIMVPPELAAQIKSLQQLLDEPPPAIAPPAPPELPRRVTGSMVTRDGELVVTYSDGTSEQLGSVIGPRGRDGVGIAGAAITREGELMLTLSDGVVLTPGRVDGVP